MGETQFKTHCTNCGDFFSDDIEGKIICPKCGEQANIVMKCPKCEGITYVNEAVIGNSGECPNCGEIIPYTLIETDKEPIFYAKGEFADLLGLDRDPDTGKRKEEKSGCLSIVLVPIVVSGLLAAKFLFS